MVGFKCKEQWAGRRENSIVIDKLGQIPLWGQRETWVRWSWVHFLPRTFWGNWTRVKPAGLETRWSVGCTDFPSFWGLLSLQCDTAWLDPLIPELVEWPRILAWWRQALIPFRRIILMVSSGFKLFWPLDYFGRRAKFLRFLGLCWKDYTSLPVPLHPKSVIRDVPEHPR